MSALNCNDHLISLMVETHANQPLSTISLYLTHNAFRQCRREGKREITSKLSVLVAAHTHAITGLTTIPSVGGLEDEKYKDVVRRSDREWARYVTPIAKSHTDEEWSYIHSLTRHTARSCLPWYRRIPFDMVDALSRLPFNGFPVATRDTPIEMTRKSMEKMEKDK